MLHRTQDWIEPDANLCIVPVDAETIAIWKDSRIQDIPSRAAGEPAEQFGAPALEMKTGRASLEGLAVVDGRWLWTIHRDGQLVTWDLSALDETGGSTALQKVPVDKPEEEEEPGADAAESDDEQQETELRLPVAEETDLGFQVCEVEVHREAADTLLALGGETGRVGLVVGRSGEAADGQPPAPAVASSRGHNGDVTALAFGPKMQRIASAGQDDRIMVWSTSTEQADPARAREEPEEAEALDDGEIADEARVVSAELQVGDESGETDGVAPGDTSGAEAPADLPDADGGDANQKAETIDTELSEDRPNRLSDDLLDTEIKPPEHDRRLPRLAVLSGSQGWPLALAFSPSGDRLVSGAMDNAVYLWDVTAEEPLVGLVSEHHNWVSDVAFSADGSTVVSASWDGTLGIFDGADLTPKFRVTAHTDYVTGVSFTPGPAEQSQLVSVGYDGRVGVWDWRDGSSVTTFQAHADWIEGVRWFRTADSPRCATITSGGVVRVWEMDGTEVAGFGTGSSEAFDLGRQIDFNNYVDVGRLASDEIGPIQREEARLGEVRDYESQAGSAQQVRTETAVSMLESAIEQGDPAVDPEGGEPEEDKPDEATALETFEAKLEESGIETPDVENPEAKMAAADVPAEEKPAELAPGDQAEPSTPEDATVPEDAPDPEEIGQALERATSEKEQAVRKDDRADGSAPQTGSASSPSQGSDGGDGRARDREIDQELANLGGLEEGERPEIETKTDEVDISVQPDNPLGRERETSASIEDDLEHAGATEQVSHQEPDIEEDLEAAGATENVELGGPSLDEDLATAGAEEGVNLEGPNLDEDLKHAGASGEERTGSGSAGSGGGSGDDEAEGKTGQSPSTASPSVPDGDDPSKTSMSPGMATGASTEADATEGSKPTQQQGSPVSSDESVSPDETIAPAQNRAGATGSDEDKQTSGDTQQGTAVSPSAMPSTAADDGSGDGDDEDHEFSERPKSAEELREGLSKLSEQTGADAESGEGGEDVVDTTAQDIWTEQAARHREGAHRTETAPMSAVADAGGESQGADGKLEAWQGLKTPLDWVYGVAWRPEADEIAACGQSGAVYIWNADGEQAHALASSGEELRDVEFTPDGRVVVSGGDDGGVHLWLLPEESGGEIRHARLSGHDSWINGIAVRSDGKWALSASKDRTARLWNLESGECAAVLQGHGGPVTSVGFTDNHVWTAGRDGLVAQWTMTGERELQWTGYGEIIGLDATGGSVCWVTESGKVHVLEGPERVAELRSHTKAARGVSYDSTDGQLATGGADGQLHVYGEDATDAPRQSLGTGGAIWAVDFHAGRLVASVESGDLRLFS